VADLVAAVGWDRGRVDLRDDHLVGWTCPDCGATGPGRGRVAAVAVAGARCPACGGDRTPEVVASVAVHPDRPSPRLTDLGLAPDEVLGIRRAGARRHVWVRGVDPDLPPGW
jgi:hypothetical protein